MIASSPDPGLVRGALLDESAPRVPPYIVVERVIVRIRKITNEEHGLTFWVGYVMLQSLVGVVGLT